MLIDDVRREIVQRKRIEGRLKIDERVEILVVVGRRKKKEDGGAGKNLYLEVRPEHETTLVPSWTTAILPFSPDDPPGI